jgi:hypothetical protein
MSDLADRIASREAMRHEENIRLNSERGYVRALAPNVWEEVKEAFRGECELISSKSKMTQLECDEPSAYSFCVNRVPLYGPAIGALEFIFDPSVPCIHWQDYQNKKLRKVICFALDGTSAILAEGKRALVLSRFVEQCLDAITR